MKTCMWCGEPGGRKMDIVGPARYHVECATELYRLVDLTDDDAEVLREYVQYLRERKP